MFSLNENTKLLSGSVVEFFGCVTLFCRELKNFFLCFKVYFSPTTLWIIFPSPQGEIKIWNLNKIYYDLIQFFYLFITWSWQKLGRIQDQDPENSNGSDRTRISILDGLHMTLSERYRHVLLTQQLFPILLFTCVLHA